MRKRGRKHRRKELYRGGEDPTTNRRKKERKRTKKTDTTNPPLFNLNCVIQNSKNKSKTNRQKQLKEGGSK